jgi:hypothetical protein
VVIGKIVLSQKLQHLLMLILLLWLMGCGTAATPAALVSTAAPCIEVPNQTPLPAYTPSLATQFTALHDGRFVVGDDSYPVRGVNYYPARFP